MSRQAFLDTFLNQKATIQVYPARVKEVTGNTCSVVLLSSELEIEGVRLVADEDSESPILFIPKKDSTVLIGCIENEIANAFVCQFSELEKGSVKIGDMSFFFDKDSIAMQIDQCSVIVEKSKVTLSQDQTTVELQNGKVNMSAGSVSLKALFDDLSALIQNLKVVTSTGPSTALTPDTIVSLTQFKTKYPQLLA